jgi:hypothetical protein
MDRKRERKNRLENESNTPQNTSHVSRRRLLQVGSGAGVMIAAASTGLGAALLTQRKAEAIEVSPLSPRQRQERVFQIRRDAARVYLNQRIPPQPTNGDEERYSDKRSSFTKTLPHNDFGEVDPQAYATLLAILASGDPDRFEQIPQAPQAQAKLNDPRPLTPLTCSVWMVMPPVSHHPPRLPVPKWLLKWERFTGWH